MGENKLTGVLDPDYNRWLLSAIVESSDDAIISKDLDGTVTTWNRAAERIFGYGAAEVLGKSITLLLPPDRLQEETDFLRRLRQGELIRNLETVRVRKDGNPVPVSLTISPVRDAEGRIIGASKIARDITERKKTEEALARSEQRVRATFDKAAVGIVEVDAEDRFIAVNDRACQILGYHQREQLLGLTVHELTAPEDRALSQRLNAQLHQRRLDSFSYEKRYLRHDGSPVWVHVAVSAVRDAQGHSVRHIGTIEDISDRKRAEDDRERLVLRLRDAADQAERQRAQLEAVFQAMRDGVMVLDTSGKAVLVNEAKARINGYASAEHMKRDLADFAQDYEILYPDGRPVATDQWPVTRVLRGESVTECELRVRRQDSGQEWFLSFSAEPVRDAQGRQILAVVVTRDITERKQAEQALRESEEQHRTITEAMPHLVWRTNPTGAIEYVNGKWTEYTGLFLAQSSGSGWMEAVHVDDAYRVDTVWREAIASQSVFNCDYRLRSQSGAYRWFKSWGVPLRNDRGQVVNWFGACTDIDDVVKARDVLTHARDELERTVQQRTARLQEMVAELETFSYSIAHDMRAPLRAMQGFADAVLEDYGDRVGPEGKDYLQRIKAAAARQDHFIRDVLNYSRLVRQEPRLEPVDLDQLVPSVIAEYPNLQAARECIEVHSPLGVVLGHGPSLVQCVSNLLGNALKFVAPGIEPRVKVWGEPHGGLLRLCVQDNGLGIAPEHHNRIFRLFERLHSQTEYPGTGIGLAVVRKAAQRMGGTVGVESKSGQGSRFWMELKSGA